MLTALRSLEAAVAHLQVAANDIELHCGDPILSKRVQLLRAQANALLDEVKLEADLEFACQCKRAAADALIANYRRLRNKLTGNEDGHRANGGRVVTE